MPDMTIPLGEYADIAALDVWPIVSGTAPRFVGTGAPTGMAFSADKKNLSGTPTVEEHKFVDGGYQVGGSFVYANEGLYLHVAAMAPPIPEFFPAPLGMRLPDEITVVDKASGDTVTTMAAQVGTTQVGMTFNDSYGRWTASEELRALVAPWGGLSHLDHEIKWRGDRYFIEGPAQVARRNGQDHHFTLKLRRPDAT